MKIVITQFSDSQPVKERVVKRFGASQSAELLALLAFIDHAKGRIEAMRGMNAEIHLQKRFMVDGATVRVTAKTVNGTIPTLWAKLFS